MTDFFRDKLDSLRGRTLQSKLFLLLGACSLIAVLTTGGIAAYLNLRAHRQAVRDEVKREAEILAQFSEVVLAFEGLGLEEDLAPGFRALMRDRHVMAMVVYNADGEIFASWTRENYRSFIPPPPATNSLTLTDGWIDCHLAVLSDGQPVGTVFLRHDTDQIRQRFYDFVGSGLMAGAITSAFALLLAGLLGRFIVRPVEQLSKLATRVGKEKDFTLRATRSTDDEIGRLVDQFNGMLAQIEHQNLELQQAHDKLEDRVAERTQELLASREEQQEILNQMPVPVMILNASREIEYLNRRFAELFGFDRREVSNVDAWRRRLQLDARPAEEILAEVDECLREMGKPSRDIRPCEMYLTSRSGAELMVRVSGRSIGDRVVLLLHDVTEDRHNELMLARARDEAEAANRAKSEFLSRMSHELRTPLNGIIGFSQLLEMAKLPERPAENARRIHTAGKHLLDLINEVLDISRIEAGDLSLSPEGVQVGEIVKEVMGLVEPMARKRRVTLRYEDGGDPESRASADRQRLRQILLNLASNGIKYNREQGDLEFRSALTDQGRVRIEVRDSGPGIPEEKLARLFTPFDRLDAERTHTEVEGTGLGLSLTKRLVEAMGGEIKVSSTVGEGSVFAVELALAKDTAYLRREELNGLTEKASNQSTGDGQKTDELTVLYIEDNPDNLALVEQVVQHQPGVRLLSAIQGSQGLDLARDHRPDLVFTDYHLPDLNGDEVIARLKQDERTRDIPVYILSADALSSQINRLKDLGAADHLSKPLDIERLLALLRQAVAEKQGAKVC